MLNRGSMRYDLIIDGTTVIEGIETDRPCPNAKQVIENEYLPRIQAGAKMFDGMDQGYSKSVLILWDKVRTVEVRIQG